MRTVIQIFGSLNAGGAESRMIDVYRNIDRSQYHFVFISLDTSEGQFYESEIRSLGGDIIKLDSPRQVSIKSHVKQLVKTFRLLKSKYDADVVHAHTSYHIGIVLLAACIAGIHVRVAHARTTSTINKTGLTNRLMISLGKHLINRLATHKLALNPETAKTLYGNDQHIKIIPNAIPLQKYSDAIKSDIYEDIPQNSPVICHIGRFQPMKNHEFLIKLFSEYSKQNPDTWLILVGDGPLKKEIETLSYELGVDTHIKFVGMRKDIPQILAGVSVFVFPSKYEGLGGVVLEAQASGVSCVVSDTVPNNVDMGLNLVEFLSLEVPYEKWISAINNAIASSPPCFSDRYSAFDQHGFTLENEIKLLTDIYENANYNHNHL